MPSQTKSKQPKQMRFKLLVGRHIGNDLTQEPTEVMHSLTGEPTGKMMYPERTWTQGETVVTDTDLVKRHGSSKFMRLRDKGGDDPEYDEEMPTDPEAPSASFPGGQVSAGLQECTSTEEGVTISGPKAEPVAKEQPAVGPSATRDASRQVERAGGSGAETKPGSDKEAGQRTEGPRSDAQKAEGSRMSQIEKEYGPLEEMTVADLHELASTEEIDLGGARTKAEIIKKIKEEK
jgi:hypothetical protein